MVQACEIHQQFREIVGKIGIFRKPKALSRFNKIASRDSVNPFFSPARYPKHPLMTPSALHGRTTCQKPTTALYLYQNIDRLTHSPVSPPYTSQQKLVAIRAGGRTPRTSRSGGPHACSGASCCVGEPFWAHQNAKNLLVAGAPPRTPLGELTPRLPGGEGLRPRGLCCPLPKNPTYNIVIVLVLCVCTHVYENALLFSLEC